MSYKLFLLPVNLFVTFGDSPDAGSQSDENLCFDWCIYSHAGERLAAGAGDRRDDIARVIDQNDLKDIQVIGLVPAQAVFSSVVTIPAKQQKYLNQALPFVVEEQLAQDIEDVHIVTARSGKKDRIPVVVIEHAVMVRVMSCFSCFGFPIQAVFPDAALLPLAGNTQYTNTVLIDRSFVSFRNSDHFIKVRKHTISLYLERLFSDGEFVDKDQSHSSTEHSIKVYLQSEQAEHETITIAGIEQIAKDVSVETYSLGTIEFLAESFFHAPFAKFSLCQGPYRVRQNKNSLWQKWRGVAAVLFVWLVMQVALNIGKGVYYSQQAADLKSQSLALYQSVFPNDQRVTAENVSRFLKSKLIQSGKSEQNGGFLAYLSLAGQEFSRAIRKNEMKLKSLNYNAQRDQLSVELQVRSLEQLDALKTAISNRGLVVEIGSAVKEKDFVRGRLAISDS